MTEHRNSKSGDNTQDIKNIVKEPAPAAAAPAPADKVKNDIKISNDKAIREFIDKIPGILKTYLENNADKPVKTGWWVGGKKGKTRRMKKGRKGTRKRKGTKRR